MTGRQLKDWAAQVHDDATIEVDSTYTYSSGWKEIATEKIRAIHIVTPCRTMADVCNAEEVSR